MSRRHFSQPLAAGLLLIAQLCLVGHYAIEAAGVVFYAATPQIAPNAPAYESESTALTLHTGYSLPAIVKAPGVPVRRVAEPPNMLEKRLVMRPPLERPPR